MDAGKYGTLYPYIAAMNANIREVYRCPANSVVGTLGSGSGSNGMFDYVSFKGLAGTRASSIPLTANLARENNPERMPTPLYTEEDPRFNVNASYVDIGHSNGDYAATFHPNKSANYAAIDGSVHSIFGAIAPDNRAKGLEVGPIALAWSVDVGGGKQAKIGIGVNYGEWVKTQR